MASTSETGHGKNLANFKKIIIIIKGFPDYNPTKAAIQIPNLEILRDHTDAAFDTLRTKNAQYDHIINQRQQTFSQLKPYSTRIINALDASDAADAKVKDARTIIRKIHGKRAAKSSPNSISTSQLSYDSQIEHLSNLLALLITEPSYNPNEAALQIPTIQTQLQQMRQKNLEVNQSYTLLSNARIQRDQLLYNPKTGIAHITSELKKYLKSLYGPISQEFLLIRDIKIKKQIQITTL